MLCSCPYIGVLPENTGKGISGLVMDKHQVGQTGQWVFRITDIFLEEPWSLFSLQQRVEDKTGEGLSNRTEGVLYKTDSIKSITWQKPTLKPTGQHLFRK